MCNISKISNNIIYNFIQYTPYNIINKYIPENGITLKLMIK